MQIEYIAATSADTEAVFALNKSLIEAYEDISNIDCEKVLDWVYKKMQNNINSYTIVTADGEKAGYFYFHSAGDEMELDDLYILPQYRNMGIGTQILQKCISEADKDIFLYVFVKNEGAIRLYKRHGFTVTEEVGETRCIMKRLQTPKI